MRCSQGMQAFANAELNSAGGFTKNHQQARKRSAMHFHALPGLGGILATRAGKTNFESAVHWPWETLVQAEHFSALEKAIGHEVLAHSAHTPIRPGRSKI